MDDNLPGILWTSGLRRSQVAVCQQCWENRAHDGLSNQDYLPSLKADMVEYWQSISGGVVYTRTHGYVAGKWRYEKRLALRGTAHWNEYIYQCPLTKEWWSKSQNASKRIRRFDPGNPSGIIQQINPRSFATETTRRPSSIGPFYVLKSEADDWERLFATTRKQQAIKEAATKAEAARAAGTAQPKTSAATQWGALRPPPPAILRYPVEQPVENQDEFIQRNDPGAHFMPGDELRIRNGNITLVYRMANDGRLRLIGQINH